VTKLVSGWSDVSYHEAMFDATGLSSGAYIYHLTAGDYNATGKMILMK
jgi:hypothetical protein